MQTPEEFAREALPLPARCVEPMEEEVREFADLIRARDAEVRADERAKVLAGFDRDDLEAEVERLRGERHNLTAEVVRLRTALDDLIEDWEDTGRSDLHPLIRGAALSAAGQVRDVLWPEEADDD